MKLISLFLALTLVGCQALNPAFFQAADDVLTQQTLQITIDKETIEQGRELHLTLDVTNANKAAK